MSERHNQGRFKGGPSRDGNADYRQRRCFVRVELAQKTGSFLAVSRQERFVPSPNIFFGRAP